MQIALICMVFILLGVYYGNKEGPLPVANATSIEINGEKRCSGMSELTDETEISPLKKAIAFMENVNAIGLKLANEVQVADFAHETNLTQYNKKILDEKEHKLVDFLQYSTTKATEFKWERFKEENATLYRWFKLYLNVPLSGDNNYAKHLLHSKSQHQGMEGIYNKARLCPYNSTERKNCSLQLYPDVENIMAKSRNPIELRSMWKQFRDATGTQMREIFLSKVKISNEEAKEMGFSDVGQLIINSYESKDFLINMKKLMNKILPLYQQLHAFVRRKLIQRYKRVEIMEDGPIPAHLLGNLNGLQWLNIFDIVNPFPRKAFPNVTGAMLKKKMQPIDMFVMAENFFLSIGLERMTPYFWTRSVFEKPSDREMNCHPSAFDMLDGKDFRIKQCTVIDEKYLKTIHHEMGHIEYFMLYKHLPLAFRDGANHGFHEAVGDVMSLSIQTIDYLKNVSLAEEDFKEDEDTDIILLMKVALDVLPTAQYGYLIDYYRYQIYNGSISGRVLNKYWWKYRLEFQGFCPPCRRSEKDFDAGAVPHVAIFGGTMRYFFASIFTFQIHKSLCQRINHQGPLHRCNIHGKTEAGSALKEVLSLGKTVPWQEAMYKLTGETSELSSGPILEYFQPLAEWLKKQNKGEFIGWKNVNPMRCPRPKKIYKTQQTSVLTKI